MDLKSGYPFWAIRNGLMRAYPALEADLQCDVAIVGGGISGALIADELSAHGFDVAVIEQRDIAWGSTSASTALLQYEIDTHLTDLAHRYGEADAVAAYRGCAEAILTLQALAGEVGGVDFAMQRSLYYASRQRDVEVLQRECLLRAKHGFDVAWVGADAVRPLFGFDAPGAILSGLAARVDPYRLAHRLLARVAKRGGRVFDRSTIEAIDASSRGVRLRSADGVTVRCEHAILAAGYANERWIGQRVARNRSSYAFITDPVDPVALAELSRTLVWESARPYLYMRSTADHRLLVGGEDDAIDVPARRDARVDSKARTLLKKVGKLFPHLRLRPAFAWAGTFAETDDGLPFFGPHAEHGPRLHVAMAYGGNGITYSAIGANLLRCRIERRKHPLARLFSFDRLG